MTSEPTIIVSGLPRSGTSMMMQMLEAGGIEPVSDREREPDDDNPRGYYEHEAIKKLGADQSVLHNTGGKSAKVIHRLLTHLPGGQHYAIVLLHRNIDEVLASQQAMLDRLGRDGAKLDPQRLRAIYLGELQAAIASMNARADVVLLGLDHAQVLADPAGAAGMVASFIESQPGWTRSLDRDAMAQAVDPTLHRQRSG